MYNISDLSPKDKRLPVEQHATNTINHKSWKNLRKVDIVSVIGAMRAMGLQSQNPIQIAHPWAFPHKWEMTILP